MTCDAAGLAFTWNSVWRLTHSNVADALAAPDGKFLPPELGIRAGRSTTANGVEDEGAGAIQVDSRDSVTQEAARKQRQEYTQTSVVSRGDSIISNHPSAT